MIKTLLKTLLLLTAVGYLAFAVIKVSRSPKEMVCTGIDYQFPDSVGPSLIDADMVAHQLARKKISPKGKKLADIDIRGIQDLLAADPYIDTLTCYTTASGKICIRVTPVRPLLHVFADDGDEFYVGEHGEVMPAGGLNCDLPVVTGHVSRKFASTKLLSLAHLLRDDAYWGRQTQQVNIDPQGHLELIPRFCDQKIILGDTRDLENKLERVRLFYEKAMPKAGWNKYNVINATYNDQIICTKE